MQALPFETNMVLMNSVYYKLPDDDNHIDWFCGIAHCQCYNYNEVPAVSCGSKECPIFQVRCAWVRGSELALIFNRSDVDITRQHDWSALEMLTCIILKSEKLHP
jgi:hypothetical protein